MLQLFWVNLIAGWVVYLKYADTMLCGLVEFNFLINRLWIIKTFLKILPGRIYYSLCENRQPHIKILTCTDLSSSWWNLNQVEWLDGLCKLNWYIISVEKISKCLNWILWKLKWFKSDVTTSLHATKEDVRVLSDGKLNGLLTSLKTRGQLFVIINLFFLTSSQNMLSNVSFWSNNLKHSIK